MSPGLPKVPPGEQWSFQSSDVVEAIAFTEEKRDADGRPIGIYLGGDAGKLVRYHLSDVEEGGLVSNPARVYTCEHLVGKKINTIHAAHGRVWAGGDAGEIIEWDAATGALRLRYQHVEDRTGWSTVRRRTMPAKVMCLCTDSAEGLFSGSSDGSIMQWSRTSGEKVMSFLDAHQRRQVNAVCVHGGRLFSAGVDSKLLHEGGERETAAAAAAGGSSQQQQAGTTPSVIEWEVATGKAVQQYLGHGRDVMDVCLSGDGSRVYSVSRDTTARCYDTTTGDELLVIEASPIASARTVAVVGNQLFTGSTDGAVRRFDAQSGSLQALLDCLRAPGSAPGSMGTAGSPRCIAAGGDKVWIACTNNNNKKGSLVNEHPVDAKSLSDNQSRTPGTTPSRDRYTTPTGNLRFES